VTDNCEIHDSNLHSYLFRVHSYSTEIIRTVPNSLSLLSDFRFQFSNGCYYSILAHSTEKAKYLYKLGRILKSPFGTAPNNTHRLIDWSQKQLHTLSMESTITTVQYVTQQVYWHDTRQHVSHYDKYTQHNTATTGCPHAADVSTAHNDYSRRQLFSLRRLNVIPLSTSRLMLTCQRLHCATMTLCH